MTREEQILRTARGLGLTYLGDPPPEVLALWEQGYLRRDAVAPFTYTTVEGAIEDAPDELES